jgi:hypothetical protein
MNMKSVASRLRLLPLAVLLAVGACAAPSVQKVPMPDQSVDIADRTMSRVYLVRPRQTYGKITGVVVFDGQAEIGKVGTGSYLCWERPAGRTLMRAVYQPVEPQRAPQEGLLDLNTEPGQVYICSVELDHGTFEPKLMILPLAEGRKVLQGLDPAEVNYP